MSEGEALAKAGQFSAAIERWKRADRVAPRARHACLVGLAYTRRELWPQAEIFFSACQQRATADDPVPAWLPAAERELLVVYPRRTDADPPTHATCFRAHDATCLTRCDQAACAQ